MEWLNHFAPAIQALTAAAIVLLTFALLVATIQYVKVSEALQKPSVSVAVQPRNGIEATMLAPHVAQVEQRIFVRLINVGTGPALNLYYDFLQVNAPPGGHVIHPTGFVNYLAAGSHWETHLAWSELANRNFEFSATYKSLSGKKYDAKVSIKNRIIQSL